jgi:dTDP-4-dehydrorhamnose reductase
MKVLILGASGLVGGNCLKYLSKKEDVKVLGTHFSFRTRNTYYFDTLDIGNPKNFNINDFKPTHIIHAGALTHVDYCEEHPEESYKQTVTSTKNVTTLAERFGAKIIYISTDYVFDGKNGPYDESAETNPLSIYGKHKLEAEKLVQESSSQNLILRITNVYGDEIRNKNFISRLLKAGEEKEILELKLPGDQYATPVNAADIARAIYLLTKDNKSGIYNLASTDYLNRVQLAQKILKRFPDNNVKVINFSTGELKQAAARPLQGGLKAYKFLNEYPFFYFGSVDEYLVRRISNFTEL